MCLEALAVAAAASCCSGGNRRRNYRSDVGGYGFNGRQIDPELFRRGIAPFMNVHQCTCCPCKKKEECCRPCCD